jgi:hypothetical protein
MSGANDALLNRERTGATAQLDFIQTANQTGVPLIVIAANSPYDLTLLPGDQPALATFGEVEVQIEALVDALLSSELPRPSIYPSACADSLRQVSASRRSSPASLPAHRRQPRGHLPAR